jgi:GDP-L-fucose synthase
MNFWTDKTVLVTGGHGFVGKRLVKSLQEKGCKRIVAPTIEECDLRKECDIVSLYTAAKPALVIHLAAAVGGIGANIKYPGSFFYDNLIMGIQLIEQARKFAIPKFVAIGTICAYPNLTPVPFREEDLWIGYPEVTNAPYGLAKKMLLVQAQAYRKQYGLNCIYLLPVNMYGPGDNFNPETSHVIPALIKKCIEAKEKGERAISVWGTGKASREFLYVDDAVAGILLASEKYNESDPVNIGTGSEISIRDTVRLIVRLTDFDGEVIWDTSKPDGQPRRCLDTSRARDEFGFVARVPFEEGLRNTIAWYREQRKVETKI